MRKVLLTLLFTVLPFVMNAQLANDDCSNATVLQINANLSTTLTTPGSLVDATASAETNTCAGYDDDDVWFQFTASSTIHYISLLNIIGSATDLNHVVYEGSDCGTMVQKYCSNPNSSIASNLTIGQTYKIRIYSAINGGNQNTSFNVCITTPPPAPVNDECENAIMAIVNPLGQTDLTTTSTLYQATVSQITNTCQPGTQPPTEDVWFKFVATSSKHKIITSSKSGSIDQVTYTIYKGVCDSLESCRTYYNIMDGLIPGETYFVKANSWQGASAAPSSFTFYIADVAPVNDNCETATVLTPEIRENCTVGTQGDLTYASWSDVNVDDCSSSNYNDVWYEFTATNAIHYIKIFNNSKPGTTIYYSIYEGNDCEGLTPIQCGSENLYTSYIPGQVYKIRVYTYTDVLFDICIGTRSLIPVNDECASATVIPVSPTEECTQPIIGSIASATHSPETEPDCMTQDYADVWFEFVATSSIHTISIKNINENDDNLLYSIHADSGDCSSISREYCKYQPVENNYFEIGQTYKIRVFDNTMEPVLTVFEVCITTPPIPINDEIHAAISLPVNPGLDCIQQTVGSSKHATASLNTDSDACDYHLYDVWYEFTATNDRHVISFQTPDESYLPISLYTGTDYSDLALFSCSKSGLFRHHNNLYTGLTIGETYKIRTSGPYSFTICITTPPGIPVNDECENAITIPVNTDMNPTLTTFGTMTWSTSSPQPTESNTKDDDVWYEFTAISTTQTIVVKSGDFYSDLKVKLYDGADCGTMTELYNDYSYSAIYKGLTIGHIYKVRLLKFEYNNSPTDFNISIITPPAPPVNDLCENATLLPVTQGTTCTETVSGTTTSATYSPIAGISEESDIWYEFTATKKTHIIHLSNAVNITSFHMRLYNGTCEQLFDTNYIQSGLPIANLTEGQTYKLRLITSSENQGNIFNSFDICLTESYPTPINDDCISAISIPVNSGPNCIEYTEAVAEWATPTFDNPLMNDGKNDIWFEFTATSVKHHINIYDPSTYDELSHTLYSGSDCGTMTILYYANGLSIANNLTIGQVYKIRVGTYVNLSFKICITTPQIPENDDCTNATTLVTNTGSDCNQYFTGTLSGATATPNTDVCYYSLDVWYKFTATATNHYLSIFDVEGDIPTIQVFKGNDCSAFSCQEYLPSQNLDNLTIGEIYYIRASTSDELSGELNTFKICLRTPSPPVNDECAGAIIIPVNDSADCTESYNAKVYAATFSGSNSCDPNNNNLDVWYQFTATNTSHVIDIKIDDELGFTNYNMAYYTIYTGNDCDMSSAVHCTRQGSTSPFVNFVVGETYNLRVSLPYADIYQLYTSPQNITICITAPSISCTGAEPLVSGYEKYVFKKKKDLPPGIIPCSGITQQLSWFSLEISNPGDLIYQISVNSQFDPYGNPIGQDIRNYQYAVWGPFSDPEVGCQNLTNSFIIRCDSSINNDGSFTIPEAQTGEYYIVAVSDFPIQYIDFYIKFEQIGGTAASREVQPPTGDATQAFAVGQTLADIELDNDENVTWYANPGPQLITTFGNNNETNDTPGTETPLPLSTPLVDGTTYYVAFTIYGVESTQRFAVTVSSAPETPAPTGETEQIFATGETLANIEVNGQNIKWYNNEAATTPLPLNTLLTDGMSYAASQTINGLESIERLTVTVTLYETPTPTGLVDQSFTEGETLANLEVNGTNIKWYATETSSVVLNETTTLVDGVTYYATQTINGIESSGRLAITVHIIVTETPPPTGLAEQSFTEGETLTNLEVNGTNIKWYATETSSVILNETTPLADETTYYASQTINGIESISRLAVTVHISITETPVPTGASEQSFTEGETLANLEVNGQNIKWYASETSLVVLNETTPLVDGVTYYATQTINGIESISRLAVTVHLIITETPPPTGSSEQSFTEGETLANLDVNGENIKWYATETSVVILNETTPLVNEVTYYATQTINGTESISRLAVKALKTLGVNDNQFTGMTYYPNPVKDNLTIVNNNEIETVSIVNMLGQTIANKQINSTTAQMNLSSLQSGVYLVNITSGGKNKTIKVIKE